MIPSQNCYDLIKSFEGCRLEAYPDPATGGEPISIGFGHTGNVKLGDKITQEQADKYLETDVNRFAERITGLLHIVVTQGEFDALTSFAYNVGLGNLANSTLLKKLNLGDKDGAANEFPKWNKAAGKVMAGLTRRRNAERTLFLS